MPLRPSARERLGELLEATVVDIRTPVDDPDLVLTPPCSPQLLGALKRRFSGAPVIVVEVSDWELDVEVNGPVKRILAGGADAYVLADSIDELAEKLSGRGRPRHRCPGRRMSSKDRRWTTSSLRSSTSRRTTPSGNTDTARLADPTPGPLAVIRGRRDRNRTGRNWSR